MIEFVDSESSIVDILAEYPGYKFKVRGYITSNRLNIWINTIINRLIVENIIDKSEEYKVYIVKDYKLLRNKKGDNRDKCVVSLFNETTKIDTAKIYLVFNSIIDDFSYRYTIPDILDCITTDNLFNGGNYIGYDASDNDINTYTKL